MIVSASRRTDIPALYSRWLANRIDAGYAISVNPFNPKMTRRVDLRPSPIGDMEALVLWTRNPGPILQYLPAWEERGIRSYWLMTLTGYPKVLEPHTPTVAQATDALGRLAAVVGRERIVWRYDPIIACKELGMDASYHRENFSRLAKLVEPFSSKVIISIYDNYKKSDRRLAAAGIAHDENEARAGAAGIAGECAKMRFPLTSCCEDLEDAGIKPGGCIDPRRLDSLWNLGLGDATDKGQRSGCLCAPSVDIGRYDTCTHGCLYCYATGSAENAATRYATHDPDNEFLA